MKFNTLYESLLNIYLTEGRFTPPPKMVDKITAWVEDSETYRKLLMRNKPIKKSFDVDLTDWKYEDLFINDPVGSEYAKGTINVILKPYKKDGHSSFDQWNNTITIYYGSELKQSIRHELIHWAQAKSKVVRGSKKAMGYPSKNISTPEITQTGIDYTKDKELKKKKKRGTFRYDDIEQWEKDKKKELKKLKIKVGDYHSLDDEEFYSILDDRIYFFKQAVEDAKEKDFSKQEINDAIRNLINTDTVITTIKKYSKSKWLKMVNEIIKEVL
jgi:hypothetical protein